VFFQPLLLRCLERRKSRQNGGSLRYRLLTNVTLLANAMRFITLPPDG
jgi:hypothetical protein